MITRCPGEAAPIGVGIMIEDIQVSFYKVPGDKTNIWELGYQQGSSVSGQVTADTTQGRDTDHATVNDRDQEALRLLDKAVETIQETAPRP